MSKSIKTLIKSVPAHIFARDRNDIFSVILLVSAFTVGGLFNYLYHLVVGRVLAPDDYAIVVSFIGLTVTLTAPFGVAQTILADFTSVTLAKDQPGKIKYLLQRIFQVLGVLSMLLAALAFAAPHALADVLHTESSLVMAMLAVSLVATLSMPPLLGIAQGSKRYGMLSIARILGGASRFIIAALLIMLGFNLHGAIAGVTLSALVMLIYLAGSMNLGLHGPAVQVTKDEQMTLLRHAGIFAVSRFALAVLVSSDVIFATARFQPAIAGYYGGAATLGSILLFFIIPIQLFLFPEVNNRFAQGQPTEGQLLRPLLFVALCAIAFMVICFLFSGVIVHLYYGPEYAPAAPLLGLYAVASSGGAVMGLQSTFNIARHEWRYVGLLCVAATIQAILMGFVLREPSAYILSMAATSWATVIAGEIWLGGIFPRRATP